jgi:phosphohistidine swiveling domain-containing protein
MPKSPTPKFLFDKDPWLLGEEIPDLDVFFFQIPMSYFTNDLAYPFLIRYKKTLTHYKKFHSNFYVGETDSFMVAEKVVDALVKRPGFGKKVDRNITVWSNKLMDFSRHVASLPLYSYSNNRLWQIYKQNDVIHTKLYTYGWLPVASDLFHNNFTRRLKNILYAACPTKEEAENAFVVLATPTKKTIVAQEREEFLAIYKKYKKTIRSLREATLENSKPATKQSPTAKKIASSSRLLIAADGTPRNDTGLESALSKHALRWGHLGYIYAGNVEPFGPDHYLAEMRDLAGSKITGGKILDRERRQLKTAKNKQRVLIKKYQLTKQQQELFQAAQDFALTKLLRRHAQLLNLYLLHTSLLAEISNRLKLTRHQVQFMLMDEVKDALINNKPISKKELAERLKECVMYTERGFEKIYTGKMLKKITAGIKREIDQSLKEISGQTAQPGYAKGIVKLIFRAKDIHKMNKGDILVSIATDPDVVPAMKLAGAIVTEQGGITSHAAIVSRELGIPCIIGTKIATKIFKDGDMVEVDANKGIVKKL